MSEPTREPEDDDVDSFLREAARIEPLLPRAREPDRSGDVLGHFRIERELGRGGMGVVYEAADSRLGRRVALKLLPSDVVRDAARRERFLREARSASAVAHPNIAAVYDLGQDGDSLFIAMELVEGKTLREHLSSEGQLAPEAATELALQIARGLGKAHQAGIVHRDIKPENVMLTADGWVKILDFGLAKLPVGGEPGPAAESAAHGSVAGRIVGTPGYMSPEQAEGAPVRPSSDVYSVGVMLAEMLTGERRGVGGARLRGELGALALRCMAEDPALRPQDGAELAACLSALAHSRRRHVTLAIIAGTLALLGVITTGVVVARRSRTEASPPPAQAQMPALASQSALGVPRLAEPSPQPLPSASALATTHVRAQPLPAPARPVAPSARPAIDPLLRQK